MREITLESRPKTTCNQVHRLQSVVVRRTIPRNRPCTVFMLRLVGFVFFVFLARESQMTLPFGTLRLNGLLSALPLLEKVELG